jgi:hypothetical protein
MNCCERVLFILFGGELSLARCWPSQDSDAVILEAGETRLVPGMKSR